MDRNPTLRLFDEIVDEVTERLAGLQDWGLSGLRRTQYNHDVLADDIILSRLEEAGYAVLSEESGLRGAPDNGLTVVVDPIDGSTNGSRGLPWFATSLCAVDQQGAVVAVVANLATGERFRASRGEGMQIRPAGGAQTSVATYRPGPGPRSCEELADAIVGFSGLPPRHGGWAQFRALGAAALDMCAVAVGRLDGFVDTDRAHGVWDYLGATLVCVEAGALVTDSGGEELTVLDPLARRSPVAAATSELMAQLLAMVGDWSNAAG